MFGELNLEIANEEKLIKYGTNVELISFGIWKLRFKTLHQKCHWINLLDNVQ